MTGSTLAPFVIAPLAFVLLAAWVALVYWADAHPAHEEHPAHKGRGAMPSPDAARAREDAAAHGEHEGGAQEPSRPEPSRPGRRAA
jgi:hypothetical protein